MKRFLIIYDNSLGDKQYIGHNSYSTLKEVVSDLLRKGFNINKDIGKRYKLFDLNSNSCSGIRLKEIKNEWVILN